MCPRRITTTGGPTATLEEIDILHELDRRPSRAPDFAAESRALASLAAELATNPRNMLQRLVELAVELCHAHTSGISLLEGDVFRWEAVAGVFAGARNGTMPRHASPCGVVIDRNAMQLMELPDRCFPALRAEPRFVEALLLPFYDHGTPVGTVWIVSHAPERRFDREDARVVGVLTQYASAAWQIWTQNQRLSEASHRKDEFLATLSHELRNPFAAITAAATLLRDRPAGTDPSRRAVDVILRQSDHAKRLVDDLLDMERIERGKLTLETRQVDFRTLVAEAVDARRPDIDRRRQRLVLDLGTVPVVIAADPTRLTQVVSNLVDNATKYTPEEGHIAVTLSSGADHVSLAVEDDGEGIPADRTQAIFEPFAQIAEGGRSGGLGIGLALVRRLVDLHGGAVQVWSEGPGRGSRFTLRLPVSGAPAAA